MTPIQFILIIGFLFTGLFYFVRLRKRIADVLLLLILVGVAVLFILFPEWTSVLAKKLWVGRGTDLVLYICIVLFYFVILKLYARMRKLEQQITDIISKHAIEVVEMLMKK